MPKIFANMPEAAEALETRVKALEQSAGGPGTLTRRLLVEGTDYTYTKGLIALEVPVTATDTIWLSHQIAPEAGVPVTFSTTMQLEEGMTLLDIVPGMDCLTVEYQQRWPVSHTVSEDGAQKTSDFLITLNSGTQTQVNVDMQLADGEVTINFVVTLLGDNGGNYVQIDHYDLVFDKGTEVQEIGYGYTINFASPFGDLDSAEIKIRAANILGPTVDLVLRGVITNDPRTSIIPIELETEQSGIIASAQLLGLTIPISQGWNGNTLYAGQFTTGSGSNSSGSGSGGFNFAPVVDASTLDYIKKTEVIHE